MWKACRTLLGGLSKRKPTTIGYKMPFYDVSALEIGGHRYAIARQAEAQIGTGSSGDSLATVLDLSRQQTQTEELSAEWIQTTIDVYQEDDVFRADFIQTVVFTGAKEIKLSDKAREYLAEMGNHYIHFHPSPIPPGPYAIIDGELREVWKLVDDVYGTCMATLKPHPHNSQGFELFHCTGSGGLVPSFALRSRIRDKVAFDSPIAGFRIVTKDNIHLQGTKVSQGNKAFHDTYPPQEDSAHCLKGLVEKGVAIVGKTKMNSFGNWEEPLEYIDYQAPWNPRGDGYQSTGGSSSGSAAALAAYDWLDIAIGTDTWASVTRPALWCGLFALRPTLGTVSTKGIEPFCQVFDTAGLLGRDLQKCRIFASEWLDKDLLATNKPFSSVIWPTDYWSIIDPAQTKLARGFVAAIEAVLGISSRDVSFSEAWNENPPAEAAGQSLSDYIDDSTKAQCYDAYHNCDDFRDRYRERYGHEPYVSPPNRGMWDFAKTISKEKRDEDFRRLGVYKEWFNESFFGETDNPVIVMPLECMAPRYRDEVPNFKRPPQRGVNSLALAAVLGAPALSVPISEVPYHSRVSGQEERMPFVVALMSLPGTDLLLMDTIYDVLKKSGMKTTVAAGKTM